MKPTPARRRSPALAILLASLAVPRPAAAQEAKKEDDPASWLPILRRQAADYEIVPRDPAKKPPRPLPEPILRWTQPVRGGDDGAVYVWVADGRPEAVVSAFTYRVAGSKRTLQHEVHSLASVGLDATWRGRPMWRADRPGLAFRPVPDAPAPAPSAPARMRQMTEIARGFSATSVHEKAGKNALRLMPKALYRYEPSADGPTDGALFCLAHGTDPEVFLLLESHRNGDAPEWRYALAQFSDLALSASYKGREVWSAPPGVWDRHEGIHAYYIAELVDADTPDEYRKAAKPREEGRQDR